MKLIIRFFLIFILLFGADYSFAQQKEMFKQKRERKRLWRRWRSDRDAYNPYLKKKAKDKPSARIAIGNKKELRQQKRKDRRQMRRSKRTINKHATIR